MIQRTVQTGFPTREQEEDYIRSHDAFWVFVNTHDRRDSAEVLRRTGNYYEALEEMKARVAEEAKRRD